MQHMAGYPLLQMHLCNWNYSVSLSWMGCLDGAFTKHHAHSLAVNPKDTCEHHTDFIIMAGWKCRFTHISGVKFASEMQIWFWPWFCFSFVAANSVKLTLKEKTLSHLRFRLLYSRLHESGVILQHEHLAVAIKSDPLSSGTEQHTVRDK